MRYLISLIVILISVFYVQAQTATPASVAREGIYLNFTDIVRGWRDYIPSDYINMDRNTSRYEIILSNRSETVEICNYFPSGGRIIRYKPVVQVRVTDLQEKKRIAAHEFTGGRPKLCPEFASFTFNNGLAVDQSIRGTLPPRAEFYEWLVSDVFPVIGVQMTPAVAPTATSTPGP
jgi:hypothetical protein